MIFTKALPYEQIKASLSKDDRIMIIGCESCVRASGCGGAEKMKELALRLRKDGYQVIDGYMVPGSCSPKVLFAKPGKSINTIISLACSAGGANIRRYYPGYKIVETTRDIGLMVTDSEKKVLKVTMPYRGSEDEKDNEYGLCTGEKRETKQLLVTEARI
jgi:hypothetical protein